MPLSRMENTTFAMPSIIDFHDMGLRTVFTVRTPKGKRLFNLSPNPEMVSSNLPVPKQQPISSEIIRYRRSCDPGIEC
ncbi:hypothetical protein TNCV_36951 [Trichonephila clavipes]|nr:hypothetical protein TNCV_36951 [Trichonephila clavipes]